MKSPMSQILMIVLAIVFAAALALTILLICISYVRTDGENTAEESTLDTQETTLLPPDDSEWTEDSTTVTDLITTLLETETTEPEELGNGLAYTSNGDGTCTLTGIGICTDVCIVIPDVSPNGERVTAIAPYALYGCTFVTAIQIPASVTRIGDLAFAACNNLVYLSVHDRNVFYCDVDGILYTSDMRTLLFYPPMRAGSTVSISATTTTIAEMAFYNCAYLLHVDYAGSAAQWEEIRIGTKNYSLTAASKSFGNQTGK